MIEYLTGMPKILVRTALAVSLVVLLAFGLRALAKARTLQLAGRLVSRVETTRQQVALTFDDGPVPALVDTILAVLRSHNARATFFVTGHELAAAPAAGEQILAAGHELGNHTYSHRRMVLVGSGTIRGEIEPTDSLIRSVGQQAPIYFRPPYGIKLVGLPWFLARTDRTSVTWDIEPDSYAEVAATPEGIVRHVLDRVRPGSIILLHPWYRSRATSLAAVSPLLDSLITRGYQIVPVRDLIQETHPAGS